MSSKKGEKVPDAWDDDDWEAQADRVAQEPPKPEPAPVLNKAERMELHRESNRKIWESADNREPSYFLETNNTVPLATGFKPQVKLLSRRPTPARDPATNMANLSLDDEEDEQEAIRRHQIEAEARMREGKRLLEEKQKAYEEARRRIFGEDNQDEGRQGQGQGRGANRGRGNRGNGRGRGRGGNRRGDGRDSDASRSATSSRSATPSGPTRDQQRPNPSRSGTPSGVTRDQHRPNSSPKPPSILQKQESAQGQRPGAKSDNGQAAIREPKGPDGSGRGGFGFSRRGAK